jgi:transposase
MEEAMEVIHPRCAGLDAHKQTVVAYARLAGGGTPHQEARAFETTTSGLLALCDGLESLDVRHVAMEAAGVYWEPVWHVLEGRLERALANAAHVRNVPGRKTEVNDAMWLADLLAHGLIRASFVPPAPVRKLRAPTRTRKPFVRVRASHVQRIEKVLEDANVKITSLISDITGKSGRAPLRALIDGQTDPERLPSCPSARLKAGHAEPREALRGRVNAHHHSMLEPRLGHIDALDQAVATIEKEVGLGLRPFRQASRLSSTLPGIDTVSANVIVAKIGIDMTRFATPAHLLSWACPCPRNDESAGKRRGTWPQRGGKWLKTSLVQAAWAAVKVKGGYLQAQFHRIRIRCGASHYRRGSLHAHRRLAYAA